MAWPPPTLPINQTNATPQQNTHPQDHAAANQAINDTVAYAKQLPRGVIGQKVKATTSGGFGAIEYAISELYLATPSVAPSPQRLYTIRWSLNIKVVTAITSGYIFVAVKKNGDPAQPQIGSGAYHLPPAGTGPGYGINLIGEIQATGLDAVTTYGLTTISGAGTYSVQATSWVQLIDVGTPTPM